MVLGLEARLRGVLVAQGTVWLQVGRLSACQCLAYVQDCYCNRRCTLKVGVSKVWTVEGGVLPPRVPAGSLSCSPGQDGCILGTQSAAWEQAAL